MNKIVLFAVPMAVTIPFTFLLCRLRIAWKRRVSFGTVLFSALVVTVISLGIFTLGDIYTVGFWDGSRAKAPDRELMLKVIAFMLLTCALPALAVVHRCQRRTKTDQATPA